MKTLNSIELATVSGSGRAFQHPDGNWYELIEIAPGLFQLAPASPPFSIGDPPPSGGPRPPNEYEAFTP